MNEEFENRNESTETQQENLRDVAAQAIEDNESAEQPAAQPQTSESIPNVEAQKVEEPSSNPTYQNPIYSQQPYSGGYGQQQNQQPYGGYSQPNPQQPYYYNNPAQQPPVNNAKKKTGKGLKIFAACLAVIIVFALGFGVSSIVKHSSESESSSSSIVNGDGPNLNINESPVTPTKVSTEGVLTPAQIAAKCKPSNVGIVVYSKNSNSAAGEGSGVIMGEDKTGEYTYIITCAHVINDAGISARVQTEDGTTYDAEIVGFDTRTDLGVLKIKASGLPAAEFGDSNSLTVGDPIYAIGNPGGVEFFGSFTDGYVSAIDRPVNSEIGYSMKCIQHSAAINPGNSGGMLVNAYGQVIGINSQKIAATDYEGMGFAIPITSAKAIVESLINYGYVPNRPELGIKYYSVSASAQYSMIAQIKGLPAGTLIIAEIDQNSSLTGTEVRKYDMITAVNGTPLTTADVLIEKIDSGKVGDKMTLSICRVNSDYSTSEFDVEITLVEDKGNSEPVSTTTAQYVDPFQYFSQFGY